MRVNDILGDALAVLAARPGRTLSLALGVAVGVASLVAMLAIGSGARAEIEAQVASLGSNLIMILPERQGAGGTGAERFTHPTLRDLAAIEAAVPEIAATAPALQGTGRAVAGNRNRTVRINGTTADYFRIRDWPLLAGRPFTERDQGSGRKVALLGRTTARALFGETDPVGRQIRLLGAPFDVIGVLSEKGQSAAGRDQDDIIFLPYRTARARLGNAGNGLKPDTLSYAMAMAVTPDSIEAARRGIEGVLRGRLSVVDPAAALDAQRSASRTVSLLLLAVSLISLAASGIGIMNAMLASVAERQGEIGLRRALGARARDIARLFLAEGVLICLAGGVLGAALGVGATALVAQWTGWTTRLSTGALLAALALTSVTGIACSMFPALRAAGIHPADAMRGR